MTRHLLRQVTSAAALAATLSGGNPLHAIAAPRHTDPAIASLAPGWNRIATGEGTSCIDGSAYAFYFRPGDPNRLAIIFAGGGACWSGPSCDTCGGAGYRIVATASKSLLESKGLFNFADDRNPLRGFTCVFVSYCTGDVHLGTRVATYSADSNQCHPDRQLEIRHIGYANATAVLHWVFQHAAEPRMVIVAGHSAGAIPTPFYAVRVAKRYPKARVVQFGDAAGGYDPALSAVFLKAWHADELLRQGWGGTGIPDSVLLTCEQVYVASSHVSPRIQFCQVNLASDSEQQRYLRLTGSRDSIATMLARNLGLLHRSIRRFRSFTAPGALHVVSEHDEFYSTTMDGVALRDWLAALIAGRSVRDVGKGLLYPER